MKYEDSKRDLVDRAIALLSSLSYDQQKEVLEELNSKISKVQQGYNLPLSIFHTKKLSSLEIIVKYLKENENLKFSKIAKLLNRKPNTISTTYKKATKKFHAKLLVTDGSKKVPLSIFQNRELSVLETLVDYLVNILQMNYSEIAEALQLNYQTIRTVNLRAKKKMKKEDKEK